MSKRKVKRRRRRYRLAHPEKLIFSLVIFLLFVLIVVLLFKAILSLGGSKNEGGSSVQIVQNTASNGGIYFRFRKFAQSNGCLYGGHGQSESQ